MMAHIAMVEDMFLLRVLGVSLLATFAGCADFTGTEFAVMFAEKDEFPDMSVSYILFTISGPANTLVTISSPGHTYMTNHRIGSNGRLNVTLPEYMKHWNSLIIEPNGIIVSASAAVTVRCINKYANVSQGYTAIPKHSASTTYIAVSHDPAGRYASYILVTAYDDATTVDVHFKFPRPGKCVNMDTEVTTGHSLTFTLNSLDVWGVRCDQDLTGTSVTSSAPVAVVSGLASLFSALPFLETMLLPVDLYGNNYALPSYTAGSMYRVVAASNDTLVSLARNTKMLLSAGDFLDVPESNSLTCMTTNKPVQVVMLGVTSSVGAHTIVSSLAHPMMMPMPPVERFLTSYNLYVESSSTMVSEHITLVAPSDHIDELAASIQFVMIAVNETSQCCNMSQVTGVVPNGTTVNLASSVPFTIIYNHFHVPSGALHGYFGGANLDPVTCPVSDGYQYLSVPSLCLKVHTTVLSWTKAKDACLASGDRLVKLDTEQKNIAVVNLVTNTVPAIPSIGAWIGLQKYDVWEWTDGESSNYTDWYPNQPDNSGTCAQLLSSVQFQWDDFNCAVNNSYVCEKVLLDPTSTTIVNTMCNDDIAGCPASSGYMHVAYSNTTMCLRMSDTRQTWAEGMTDCQNTGGHLVKVDTQEKNELLYTYLKLEATDHRYYIGLWDSDNTAAVWTDCTVSNYTNWYGVEPNHLSEQCAQMNLHENGGWLDVHCNDKKISICEADTISNHVVGHIDEHGTFQCNASDVVTSSYSSDVATTVVTVFSSAPVETTSTTATTVVTVFSSDPVESTSITATTVVTVFSSDPVESTSITATPFSGTQPPLHNMATTTEPSTSFLTEPTPSVTATSASFHTDPTPFNTETAALETQAFSSTLASSELLQLTDPTGVQPYGPTTISKDMESKLTDDHNPQRVTREVCRCACIPPGRLSQLSPLVVKRKAEEIRRELILNTKNLTKTIAQFKSAEDERKSAVGIGILGVFLITFPMTLMILSDLCTMKFRN
ncbi:uncharacterized protein LOC124283088 [Haliotis rubra]|uniref:uncharacterized protein LOC124283088 n=1 Tax=Haliotis rubra TaxID=36100 RepID=UPI001EE53347|nr:uncharacterized protein LOC124283088 [Haliotis rubra]